MLPFPVFGKFPPFVCQTICGKRVLGGGRPPRGSQPPGRGVRSRGRGRGRACRGRVFACRVSRGGDPPGGGRTTRSRVADRIACRELPDCPGNVQNYLDYSILKLTQPPPCSNIRKIIPPIRTLVCLIEYSNSVSL